MNWWCSTQSGVWTWEWQPYLGVWVIGLTLAFWYYVLLPRRGPTYRRELTTGSRISFGIGLFVFWLVADWPVAALGASYLLSLHTLQYMLYAFALPPLVLFALPQSLMRRWLENRLLKAVAGFFNRPLLALVTFNLILLATHLDVVIEGFTSTQLGSFVINAAWLFSGFLFWWHIMGPLPEMNPMPYPQRLMFLLGNIFAPVVPASFMLFSEYPIYSTYELAARVSPLSAIDDQRIAAMVMKVLGVFVLIGIGSVLFFRWSTQDADREPQRTTAGAG